jgi:hypothetical protein
MSERREFTRVPLRIQILVKGSGQLEFTASTLDLSLRGVRVESLEAAAVGQECELRLTLGEGPQAIQVEILGRVARVDGDGVGLEFEGVRGAESLDHLRRLVLYNAPDAPQAEAEILGHRGLKRRQE